MIENLNDKRIYVYWFIAFILASIFLSFSSFKSESNDSKYYSELVVRYHDKEWKEVLTPKWGVNYWGFEPNSYMRDQLPGQVLMGVALTKLGIPAEQSLHILGMAFQILSILLLFQIALQLTTKEESSVLLYSLLLTPLAFSYNIRANHELGIMFFSFLALYAGLMLPKSKRWSLVIAISCLALLWIKGPFFIFGFSLSTIGFIFSALKPKKISHLIIALMLSSFLVMASGFLFEFIYHQITNESFFNTFWKIQFQQRALNQIRPHTFLVQKIVNFYYYFSHYLAYALPWSFLVFALMAKNIRKIKNSFSKLGFLKSRLSLLFLCSAMTFNLVFALFDRIAGRYVFPGYFLFSAWIVFIIYNYSDLFKKLHSKLSSFGLHLIAPALWLIAFALHFL